MHRYLLQLKLYAERGNLGKSNLILGDTYSAKAYNDKALRAVLERDKSRIINIIICTSVFVIFFSFVIVILLTITFFCSKSHTIENVKKKKPVVLSLTVLSGIANIYIVSLVSSALGFWYKPKGKIDILHTFHKNINEGPLFTAFFTDIIALSLWFILVLAAGCTYGKMVNKTPEDDSESCSLIWCTCHYYITTCGKCCCNLCKCHKLKRSPEIVEHKHSYSVSWEDAFIILSATVLCPVFCIIAHSPYIAIAYLNDGDHASSMFIYYMVLCYLLFGMIWLFFHWCQHFIDKDKKDKDDAEVTQETNEDEDINQGNNNEDVNQGNNNEENYRIFGCCTISEIERGIPNKATPKEQRQCFITAVIILVFVALLFLFGLIVVISCYFVVIPINKSISDAPNRLLSIYQSGGFLIGSFIVFNILKYFHAQRKKKDIRDNVENIHNILKDWLFHPKQQLYRLQKQLNKLEKESKKVQKLSQRQGNPPEDDAPPEDHPPEDDAPPEDHPPEDNAPPEDHPPEDNAPPEDHPPEDNAPPEDPPPPVQPGDQPQSKSLQKIRDLQKQLQKYRQQLDLLNQQNAPPDQWHDRVTQKLNGLQEKLNGQERECQQQQ